MMNHKECIMKIIKLDLKTSMLRSSLRDYSDPFILAKGTIAVTNTAAEGQPNNGLNKNVTFKNCAPFTKAE